MASRWSLSEEDLLCPVCFDNSTDPAVLACSHRFCKTCWNDEELRDCPVCKRTVCSLHEEKLQLFCQEHKEPICFVCRDSRKHKAHCNIVPVDEVAQDHREEVQAVLTPLHEKLKMFKEVKQTYDQTADAIKTQADNTERNIKEEFKKLHQILQEEEEIKIAVLRVEEMEKRDKMRAKIEGINREIASLSGAIKVIEEELKADDVSFLQNIEGTKERAQVTLPDPQLFSGALIDVAKHLGNLTFSVWEKMKEVVKFTPVILDPNTANPGLSLSGDLTSVGHHGPKQRLPDNPERFSRYGVVLGSEGFSSGKHSWEVEVGDHPDWNIGVARESIDKKGGKASPKNGIWCILQKSGMYSNGLSETLALNRRAQRIRVQLDCDGGEVSFYDPEDKTHIHTYTDTFTEKLYPYFAIGEAGDSKHSDVKILQSKHALILVSITPPCGLSGS